MLLWRPNLQEQDEILQKRKDPQTQPLLFFENPQKYLMRTSSLFTIFKLTSWFEDLSKVDPFLGVGQTMYNFKIVHNSLYNFPIEQYKYKEQFLLSSD